MSSLQIQRWTAKEVADWLRGLDDSLKPYIQSFLSEGYTGERLLRLTPQDLDELKISKLGHQEVLLEAVELLKSIMWGQLTYFAVLRLLAELSTPFVNQRYFLDVLGKKTSSAYVVNGVLLTIVFFLTRIIVIPPYYQFVYGILTTRHIHHIHWGFLWVGGSVMLDILNIWWFRKIVRGAMKTVVAAMSAKTDVGEENGDGDAVRNHVKGE